MENLVKELMKYFENLITLYKTIQPVGMRPDPECDLKLQKHAEELRNILNSELGESNRENFKSINCEHVFISKKNSDDPFYALVIPTMPTQGNILEQKFIRNYSVDIDLAHLGSTYDDCSLDPQEMTAWLIHELYANMLTDITMLRYKKLFIKYYDANCNCITSSHNNLGTMCWFGVFGNTKKDFVKDTDTCPIHNAMRDLELAYIWNDALRKYVIGCGGDYNILTDNHLHLHDKDCLEMFNKLSRKYNAYAVRYCTRDYEKLTTYMCANIGSELLKFLVKKEPEFIAAIPEGDVFNIFDTRRLLKEEAEMVDLGVTDKMKENKEASLMAQYGELRLDVKNVECESDKLYVAAKLKDFLLKIEHRIAKDPTNQDLLQVRNSIYEIARELDATKVDDTYSELEIR